MGNGEFLKLFGLLPDGVEGYGYAVLTAYPWYGLLVSIGYFGSSSSGSSTDEGVACPSKGAFRKIRCTSTTRVFCAVHIAQTTVWIEF